MSFNFYKWLIIAFLLLILVAGFFLIGKIFDVWPFKTEDKNLSVSRVSILSFSISPSPSKTISPAPTPTPHLSISPAANVLLEVPFFAQAPFGEWDNPIFQDGCEEAAIIMAWNWVQGKKINKEQAKQEILDISDFEVKNFGYAPDRSAADTAHLMKAYTGYQNVAVHYDIGATDIKRELSKGRLVITPVNGQILKNPFYTPPGPERHMVVIIGYDVIKDEFIVNDIGTRHGEKFRYSAVKFEASLQDYPTGDHLPATPGEKAMIVVEPR